MEAVDDGFPGSWWWWFEERFTAAVAAAVAAAVDRVEEVESSQVTRSEVFNGRIRGSVWMVSCLALLDPQQDPHSQTTTRHTHTPTIATHTHVTNERKEGWNEGGWEKGP